ncbi:hypothetical protein L1D15_01015 [Vibrio sp. Isolate25]|uniref:hypothetical protein n=1 Tax=Vibrio sp. Isolate25 TaxID=2908535 RepID=UPI001EFE009F|nr:hypothetical protein [Vibrio sp. Isolate25]MCG9595294.1 hypothetical protein [Vibrio sp. Isolate25]
MSPLLLHLLLLTTPAPTVDASALPLKCRLLHTADNFWFYREQMVYESEQFVIFQNFKGRVVTQVDLKTNELIRTTYIGKPYDPKYQILLGLCDKSKHTVEMWKLKQVPYDN